MIVIGDVHGCYKTLLALMEILPQTKDICFVGDLTDRGPQSREVVAFVRDNDYKCVLGNHEEMINEEDWNLWFRNGGGSTLDSYVPNDRSESIWDRIEQFKRHADLKWFRELPLLIEYKDYLISHSYCYDGDITEPYDVLWGRWFNKNNCDKINVFGHTPLKRVRRIHSKHWMIDTGCCYGNKLSAIDLETEKVYSQDMID